MNLIDLLEKAKRIDLTLFGRILSEEDKKKARFRVEITKPSTSDSKVTRKYFKDGEDFVVEKTRLSLRSTRDFSDKHRIHTGYYPDERISSRYNQEGKLKERKVTQFDAVGYPRHDRRTTFNPPGRIIGEREVLY